MKLTNVTRKRILIVSALIAGGALLSRFIDTSAQYSVIRGDVFSQEPGIETVVYTQGGYLRDTNSEEYSYAAPRVFIFSESGKLILTRYIAANEGNRSEVENRVFRRLTNSIDGLTGRDYLSAKSVRYEELNESIRTYLPHPHKSKKEVQNGK